MPTQSRTTLQHITDFLALKRSTVGVLAMVVLILLGERMAERFLPLYLVALGGGAFSVGLLNGMDNLLSALYSFPGGYASDRLGYKRALVLFNLIAMIGYLIVILFISGLLFLFMGFLAELIVSLKEDIHRTREDRHHEDS